MKQKIQNAILSFRQDDLFDAGIRLFETLGYNTGRQSRLERPTYQEFYDNYLEENDNIPDIRRFEQKALTDRWESVEILFQLSESEMTDQGMLFDTKRVDRTIIEAYLFFAIELKDADYSRTKLSDITRQMNRVFPMPVMLLFRYGEYLTLSVIKRRLHKRDESRDVLEKVTLVKNIRIDAPHRAHIEILADLSLDALRKSDDITSFVTLHNAWQKVLDCSELNRKFYRELSNWYLWALKHAVFPSENKMSEEIRNPVNVIRLITRLIFVWFIREKGLIPEDIFEERKIKKLLKDFSPESGTYYKAILQNLFFATLNTPMKARTFRTDKRYQNKNKSYMMHNCYRYLSCFRTPDKILKLLEKTPFLNGGLFECLDSETKPVTRIDGVSDRKDNELHLPNFLFFSESRSEDLNRDYGTRNRKYQVRGLINLLRRYKFTVAENTPVEEEIALDPELLGRAFENLLASYNPETGTTARKQTGSFYTPREIVSYMVDESLIAYLENRLTDFYEGRTGFVLKTRPSQGRLFEPHKPVQTEIAPSPKRLSDAEKKEINGKLRHLLSYSEEDHQFTGQETEALIAALHQLKILDPACGSGAFPMGILHKILHILRKTDPENARWKEWQIENETRKISQDIETAERINDDRARDNAVRDLNERLENINEIFGNNELDYARKLYLIQNCIFGVDIQSVAVQIAKLRFFISLVVDQKKDEKKENLGVLPLPNLETRFIAANTLIGVEESGQMGLKDNTLSDLEDKLRRVRERYFNARRRDAKKRCMKEDAQLRKEISKHLGKKGFSTKMTKRLAQWDLYDQNASADFFDPEWMFGIRNGFDITIGNPPYVRADSGGKHLELRKAIESGRQYETLWEKWDLYIPFIERSYKLLKQGGISTMIVSDAFCHSKYAQKSQKWFLKNSRIIRLDFFSKIKIFEASVRNITYFFQRADGSKNKPERRVHDPEFGAVRLLATDEQQRLTYRAFFPEDTAVKQFSVSTVILKEIFYISVGMVVNAHEKLAPGAFDMKDLVADSQDQLHPKPFVEGKHLGRWLPTTVKWLEWGTERAPALFRRPTFPEIYEVREKVLAQRSPGADPKCCFDDLRLHFTASSVGFIPWHNLSGVRNRSIRKSARYKNEKPPHPDLPKREELEKISRKFSVKYLLAVMNSKVAGYFLRTYRRSNIHLYPDDWKKLPVPDIPPSEQEPFVTLVDYILFLKRIETTLSTARDRLMLPFFEQVADGCVYELYFKDSLKRAEKDILKYLKKDLRPIMPTESQKQTLAMIKTLSARLYDPTHPVRQRLYYLDSVREIRIIKGLEVHSS